MEVGKEFGSFELWGPPASKSDTRIRDLRCCNMPLAEGQGSALTRTKSVIDT
jgi:hypothetical protein